MLQPICVVVTGGAGRVGTQVIFALARGDFFGLQQSLDVRILEIDNEEVLRRAEGVFMEAKHFGTGLLTRTLVTSDPQTAFASADYVLLVGAKPRTADMERKDLLIDNGRIFVTLGRHLSVASSHVKVVAIGNPANTNGWLVYKASGLPSTQFTSLMMLDHLRLVALIAEMTGRLAEDVAYPCVWGDHGGTMFPDTTFVDIGGGHPLSEFAEQGWFESVGREVAGAGKAVIVARGLSSAESAAHAVVMHVRALYSGIGPYGWVSMGTITDGSLYGIEPDLMFGGPTIVQQGVARLYAGLTLNDMQQARIAESVADLMEQRAIVAELLDT